MKLEVGMIARTKEGIIGKYNVIKEFANVPNFNGFYETKEKEIEYIDDKPFRNYDIKNASYNIIDLIEVGDYVNGSLVIEIRDYTDDNIKRIVTERSAMYSVTIREDELLNNLKSIVTKEQFKSLEYEV